MANDEMIKYMTGIVLNNVGGAKGITRRGEESNTDEGQVNYM